MEQVIDIAEKLQGSPDLFPWVCFATVVVVIIAQHKRIIAYFDARIESYNAKQQSDAVIAELIRNNTAALENNTAALEMVKADRGETRRMITYHENISSERISTVRDDLEHIQLVVNRIDATVSSNSENIKIIEDRTAK